MASSIGSRKRRRGVGSASAAPAGLKLVGGAHSIAPLLGKRRGYLRIYMPNISRVATVSGSFALLWSALRSGLVFRALKRHR